MFAYCNNNPVMYFDPSGEMTALFDLISTIMNFILQFFSKMSIFGTALLPNNSAVWPLDNNYNNDTFVNSKWGFRTYDYKHHQGIDLLIPVGTPVYAVADGVVVAVDTSRQDSQGIYMILEHNMNGVVFYTRYMHLNDIDIELNKQVSMGDKIADSGNTAEGTSRVGAHLHFQIQMQIPDTRTQTINPLKQYHQNDTRYNSENPNPFYVLENGSFIFNESFDPEQSQIYFEQNHWSVSTSESYKNW